MKREVGVLILGAAAAALAFLSALEGLSWRWLTATDVYIEQLAARRWVEDEQTWRRHFDAQQVRRALLPFDYRSHWRRAELLRWQANGQRLWPDQHAQTLAAARNAYHQAVARSPHNGKLVARTATRMVEMADGSAVPLMRRALAIAPYEPVVQYHVADVALRHWSALDQSTQETAKTVMRHAMKRGALAGKIKRMAQRLDREAVLMDVSH